MREKTCIIAIDPDCIKSGVAEYDGRLTLRSLTFPKLLEHLQRKKASGTAFRVIIEAGWLVKKSCFHPAQGKGAEKIAKDVGANHQIGKTLAEMCEHYGIPCQCVPPLAKCWKGPNKKITHEELAAFKGIILPKRTNPEERDAALLALHYSGYPIVIRAAGRR